MIRRTLCAWKTEELVEETIEYCRRAKVDEIIWISESSGRYEELLPIEGIEALLPGLHDAKARTESAGMIFSINPLTTIGHGDYGRKMADVHPRMEFMVDYTGKKSKACACPLCPDWRQLMQDTFRLYAGVGPTHLWIEDDFRYHFHGAVTFGCFCDRHLGEFAARTGMKFSREELAAALLRPGKADPVRAAWHGFLGDTLCETVNLIARSVHQVSPTIHVSWMSTNPAFMDLCGTDVSRMMDACADGHPAGIRMVTTRYEETTYRDMLILDEHIKKILPYLPVDAIRCTEIETFPHSLFSKSAAGIAAQVEWSNILGVCNHTMNLFDYVGSPMELTPKVREVLAARKDGFESFARAFDGAIMKGIGGLNKPRMSAHSVTTQGKTMAEIAPRENGFVDALRAFGMPMVFGVDEPVTATTGQALRSLSHQELEALFSRGVLLDGSALEALADLGRADWAGVQIRERIPVGSRGIGPEELTDPEFGGGKFNYTWTAGLWPEFVLVPQRGARIISQIVDVFGKALFPGFVIFENQLGGRTAVCPYNLGGSGLDPLLNRAPAFFYSEYRKIQIRAIVQFLSRGKSALIVDADGWVLPHRADKNGEILLAAMNLNPDCWEKVSFRAQIEGNVRAVTWANPDGVWKALGKEHWLQKDSLAEVQLHSPVPHLRTIAVRLETR